MEHGTLGISSAQCASLHHESCHIQDLWHQHGRGCAGEHRPELSIGSRAVCLSPRVPRPFLPGEPSRGPPTCRSPHLSAQLPPQCLLVFPPLSLPIRPPPTIFCCQECSAGYTRMPSGLYLGTCERCNCHGHSEVCEPETGVCQVSPAPPLAVLRETWPPGAQPQPALCPSRDASTTQWVFAVSSASQGTMGMPIGAHHRTASPARAMEPLLLASESGPYSCLKCPPFLPPLWPSTGERLQF